MPQKDGQPDLLPEFPLEPKTSPPPSSPTLPKVDRPPVVPGKATPVPKVKLGPRSSIGETSIQGGQFHVHAKVKEHRDKLLEEAEATRRMVANALRMDPAFTFPIVVQIRETSALRPGQPQVWSNISQTADGFRFEVNLVPQNNAVPGPLLQEELVRCILAEMLLRHHAGTDLSGHDVPPPDWLLYGLLELLEYQALGRPSDVFSTVFRLGHVLSVDDIFAANPRQMDSVSRTIYRSSCCGLLLMLMEQRDGRQHLAELFKILAVIPGDDTAIARAYPELTSSGNSLGKWWSLQLATMAQPGLDELLNTQETEAELAKALIVQLPPEESAKEKPAGKGPLSKLFGKKKKEKEAAANEKKPVAGSVTACPISEYTRILPRKDRGAIFGQAELALTQLAMRAHPLYRPVINEYLTVVKNLTDGKKEKEAASALTSLAGMRQKIEKDMQSAEDYLDWFEATQSQGRSSDFDEYLRTAASLAKPPPPRRDPVSRYMNLMESEYKVAE